VTSALADLDDARARRIRPPSQPRTHRQVAGTMTLPDGPHAGEIWDPATEPIQSVWIARLDDARFKRRTLVTPSQRGKSLMGIALPLVRTLTELCQNVSYIMPNLDKLNQSWEGKIKPLIVGCGYGAWLPEKGPGSRGGRPAAITLRNPETGARTGTLYFQAASGGGKETSLASVTAQRASADEGDDFESEAHLKLGQKRTESYGDAGEFDAVSTVNERKGRDGHPILQSYALGTRTRVWFQCPHCAWKGGAAGFQILKRENLTFEGVDGPTARRTARYRCDYCDVLWTEGDRKKALAVFREVHHGQAVDASGNVTGPEPSTDHYSLLANDLEWNMAVMGRIAEDEWAAKQAIEERGDHSLMRQLCHKRWCLDYTADVEDMENGAELTWGDLLGRSQKCAWGPSVSSTDRSVEQGKSYTYSRHIAEPPNEAQWAIGGVDVQNNRIYYVLMAANRQNTTWDCAWGYQYARPDHMPWDTAELHRLLDSADLWFHRTAGTLSLPLIGLDTGDFTKELNSWLQGRSHTPWRAIKGTSSPMNHEPGDIEGIIHRRGSLYSINSDATRDLVQAAYRRPNGEPGAAHIPKGLHNLPSDRAYLQHLVAEMRIFDQKTKKTRLRQGPGRWDWLDCRRIAYALNRLHLQRVGDQDASDKAAAEPQQDRGQDTWDSAVD
jgi:phage terminase large subunit GpA-like protein